MGELPDLWTAGLFLYFMKFDCLSTERVGTGVRQYFEGAVAPFSATTGYNYLRTRRPPVKLPHIKPSQFFPNTLAAHKYSHKYSDTACLKNSVTRHISSVHKTISSLREKKIRFPKYIKNWRPRAVRVCPATNGSSRGCIFFYGAPCPSTAEKPERIL